jgi:hypothetical protein
MAYDFNGSTQFLSTGISPVESEPLTMALWFNRKNSSSAHGLLAIDRGSNAGTGLHVLGTFAGSSTLVAVSNSGTSSGTATSSGTYNLNTWNHACGVFLSNNSRTVYINGGGAGTNTTTSNVTGLSNISIGARYVGGTVGLYGAVLLAEVGIWNVVLTASEIASLADGFTCDKVRPQSLIFYAPLVRDLQDVRGGLTITNNNSATVAAHPRVYA